MKNYRSGPFGQWFRYSLLNVVDLLQLKIKIQIYIYCIYLINMHKCILIKKYVHKHVRFGKASYLVVTQCLLGTVGRERSRWRQSHDCRRSRGDSLRRTSGCMAKLCSLKKKFNTKLIKSLSGVHRNPESTVIKNHTRAPK